LNKLNIPPQGIKISLQKIL